MNFLKLLGGEDDHEPDDPAAPREGRHDPYAPRHGGDDPQAVRYGRDNPYAPRDDRGEPLDDDGERSATPAPAGASRGRPASKRSDG